MKERARVETAFPGERSLLEEVNRIIDALAAPLAAASDCAGKLGQGIIPPRISASWPGELSGIKEGLNLCVDQWGALIAEVGRMSEEHNKGDIDVFLPADHFEGGLRGLACRVNEMVAGHISVKKKAMACVDEFSKGNFEAPLEQFPGKKAFINATIEHLRDNVRWFIDEMSRMSEEHTKGDIDVVIPAGRRDARKARPQHSEDGRTGQGDQRCQQ